MTGKSPNKSADPSKAQRYAESMIARARELQAADAFEPRRVGANRLVSVSRIKSHMRFDKRIMRLIVLLFAIAIIALVLFSLCLPLYTLEESKDPPILKPSAVWDCCVLWFQTNILPLFDASAAHQVSEWTSAFNQVHNPNIYEATMRRVAVTAVVLVCGFLLAVSGLLFQTAFQNPLATPSMLGVSDGVTIGAIVFVFMGYTEMAQNPQLYMLLLYGCGALAVAFVILGSRIVGHGKSSVFDMVLIGTVVCQLLGGIVNYITNFGMDIDTWMNYYEVQQAVTTAYEPLTLVIVAVLLVVSFIPIFLLRFRLNLIAFSDTEGRLLGVRTGALRAVALILGSVMQLAAIASIGQVAMLSLAVPFLTRFIFPSDFRKQLMGNFLIGAVILLAAFAAQHFIIVGPVIMPVGTIVSIVIVPFFIWLVAFQRNGWE